MLQFEKELVSPKLFYSFATTFADINDINVDCLTVSNPVPANSGKDQRYIIRYHTQDLVVAFRVKTPRIWSANRVTRYNATAVPAMGLDFKEYPDWVSKYRQIWIKIEEVISEQLTTEPVKKDRYVNAKLKYYKDAITTKFHGMPVPYDEPCQASAILSISSVYVQGKNYYPQVHITECRYKDFKKESLLSEF